MKQKVLSLILVLSLLTSVFVMPVNAATDSVLRYQHIGRIVAGLRITGNSAACEGSVLVIDNYPSMVTLELQQYTVNGWDTIESESKNFTGTGTKALDCDYTVPSGYTYRVVTTATIYSDNTRTTIIEEESGESPTDFA